MSVEKRDGKRVEFEANRIVKAIESAMFETEQGVDHELAVKIAEKITKKCAGKDVSVEEIQDIVEYELMKSPRKEVARKYITYRQQRTEERNKRFGLFKICKEIIDVSNEELAKENANMKGDTFSGKGSRIGSETAKWYAKSFNIPKKVTQAIDDNRVYVHDIDQYSLGTTNCIFIPLGKLLRRGFSTGMGSIRTANSIGSAMDLVAIIFQSQQNAQYGGVGMNKVDWDLAPYVAKSFRKQFKKQVKRTEELFLGQDFEMVMDNDVLKETCPRAYRYAMEDLDAEINQGAEALIHNLNTMSSRAGAQIPFTSINYGTCPSTEGRMVVNALLNATIAGLGNGETPIFPIQIFKMKQGVNQNPGEPNYDLFLKAIECSSKRLYPNFANIDAPMNLQYYKEDDPDTEFATMGCRTRVVGDRFGRNHLSGKGNLSFNTLNLVKLGIEHGIALGERQEADLFGFYAALNESLDIAMHGLIHRFRIQANQKASASDFMMREGVWEGGEKLDQNEKVGELLKHGSISIGFIGIAECCKALFGKHHAEDKTVWDFAFGVIQHIRNYCDQKSDEYDLNISCFATPAEGLSGKFTKNDKKQFGELEGITDREYYTNSFHVPVYYNTSSAEKIACEAPFHDLCNAGAITYVELDGNARNNQQALLKMIQYANSQNVSYFSINHPIDRCDHCGHEGIIGDSCPNCGSTEADAKIYRLRRVTGYLTGDYKTRFNPAKQAEVRDRVKHK